jgi:hypothetical protein
MRRLLSRTCVAVKDEHASELVAAFDHIGYVSIGVMLGFLLNDEETDEFLRIVLSFNRQNAALVGVRLREAARRARVRSTESIMQSIKSEVE